MTALKAVTCFVFALTLGALAPRAAAQRDTSGTQIPLSVFDQDGKFVPGIRADQLRVKDSRISIAELRTVEAPRHIVLLLDMGSNMALRWPGTLYDRWRFARGAIGAFLSKMSPQDSVSIYAFAEKRKALVVNTNDFRQAFGLVNELPVPGQKEAKHEFGEKGKFSDAFREVLNSEGDKLHFGDAIILFSCGEIGGEDYPYALTLLGSLVDDERGNLKKLELPLTKAGIRAFWFPATPLNLRFRPSGTAAMLYGEHLNVFEFISATSGMTFDSWDGDLRLEGDIVREGDLPWENEAFKDTKVAQKTTDQQGVERTAEELYRAIRTFYVAKLQFMTPPKKSAKIQMDLLDAQGHPDKSRWLFYPRNVPVE
jgi:hypothetical protein